MHSLELLPILLGPDSLAAAPAPPCLHRVGVLGCRAVSLRIRPRWLARAPSSARTPGIRAFLDLSSILPSYGLEAALSSIEQGQCTLGS